MFIFFLIKSKFSVTFLLLAWYPTTVSTGIAVVRYNLAVAYAIRGELDKSGETLKQVSIFIEINLAYKKRMLLGKRKLETQIK